MSPFRRVFWSVELCFLLVFSLATESRITLSSVDYGYFLK